MRILIKIFFTALVFMIGGALILLNKEARGSNFVGPLGTIVVLAMFGGWRAIWKYKGVEERSSSSKDVTLNKD